MCFVSRPATYNGVPPSWRWVPGGGCLVIVASVPLAPLVLHSRVPLPSIDRTVPNMHTTNATLRTTKRYPSGPRGGAGEDGDSLRRTRGAGGGGGGGGRRDAAGLGVRTIHGAQTFHRTTACAHVPHGGAAAMAAPQRSAALVAHPMSRDLRRRHVKRCKPRLGPPALGDAANGAYDASSPGRPAGRFALRLWARATSRI